MYLRALSSTPSAEHVACRLARYAGLSWLDGGLTYGQEGRWSFVGADPVAHVARTADDPDALAALAALVPPALPELPPGSGLRAADVPAWVGVVAYDAHPFGRAKQRHTRAGGASSGVAFARHDAWFAFDHLEQRVFLVGDDAEACRGLYDKYERATPLVPCFHAGPIAATEAAAHAATIAQALRHVRDGDVYEINLARCFEASFRGDPLALYLRMRALSPVPLGFYGSFPEMAVLGRSMERYLRFSRDTGRLWTSPIKGTLARGETISEHASAALVDDPKEHAEHAMVVDLMRNDLSRVCTPGTVDIDTLMDVQAFAGLYHLVSTVSGRVRADVQLADVVRETFPPGSVSGTPKQRALEIIEELEPRPRGVYTGAYGFVDHAGGCSLAVAIRTAVVEEGAVRYWAGGGIVAKSDPAREVAETELKAQMFLRALHGDLA